MTDLPGIWLGLAVFLSGVVLMLAGAKWAGLQEQERSTEFTAGINDLRHVYTYYRSQLLPVFWGSTPLQIG